MNRNIGTVQLDVPTDAGQSELWLAQKLHVKENQRVHMSGGHGAMGDSLPAAIGCAYNADAAVVSFNGDGVIQMNIQELQYLQREQLPVMVVVMNNHSLGMICGFQEANFDKNYSQTIEGKGYAAPSFSLIARAYGLKYYFVGSKNDISKVDFQYKGPSIVEIEMPSETSLNPNFGRNGLIQDQRPYIDRKLFKELMRL